MLKFKFFVLGLALSGVGAQKVDECPKDEYACHDIMNSSQCIEQLIIEKLAPATREALIKCVEYEGTVTNLPGATKVSIRIPPVRGLVLRDKSTVDALDATQRPSPPSSRSSSHRHVLEDTGCFFTHIRI